MRAGVIQCPALLVNGRGAFRVTDDEDENSHLLSLDSFYGWLEEQRSKAENPKRQQIQQLIDELTPIAEQYHYLWVR